MSERRLWSETGWTDDLAPAARDAVVVDSFLVSDGTTRAVREHQQRFLGSCLALGIPTGPGRLAAFLAAVPGELPRYGRWFPRVEAHPGDPAPLVLWLRPAPALSADVSLWVHAGTDPRRYPGIKGPDLASLAELRLEAHRHGADDAVLVGPDGSVLEAAHAGLLWWRGHRLYRPDPELAVLPSVTARRLTGQAHASGQRVWSERCTPETLAEAEVWAVNALHGIRPVVGWRGAGLPEQAGPVDQDRLARYRALVG